MKLTVVMLAVLALSAGVALAADQPAAEKPAPAKPEPKAEKAPQAQPDTFRVRVDTTKGTFILELNHKRAPVTVDNFLRYVDEGYYNGTIFHRVISHFMIQGGGFTVEMQKKTEGLHPGIKNEWDNGLNNVRGTIAMARMGGNPDSATSQFFINVVDNLRLSQAQRDGAGYAVFGKVVDGMDVVDAIRFTPVDTHPLYGGGRNKVVPVEPVVIESIVRVDEKGKVISPANKDKKPEAKKEDKKPKEKVLPARPQPKANKAKPTK